MNERLTEQKSIYLQISEMIETDILREILLEEEQVVLVPGTAFGEFGEGYIRLSYAASMESLEQGFDRIAAFMGGCHG